MTDIAARLDEIAARADAAMPGPWHWTGDYPEGHCPHAGGGWEDHGPDLKSADTYIANIGKPYQATYNKPVITSSGYDASSLHIADADAEFIAAARSDVPRLVAALRAVLDGDLIRREIQAEIEDSTDPRGHINHFDLLPDRCADRIHAHVAAALVTT